MTRHQYEDLCGDAQHDRSAGTKGDAESDRDGRSIFAYRIEVHVPFIWEIKRKDRRKIKWIRN